jgi:hypothetical protein
MIKSFIVHQWKINGGSKSDHGRFTLLPLRIFKGGVKDLFNSWIKDGQMTTFKLEVIYEN